jgi:transposase-like protein
LCRNRILPSSICAAVALVRAGKTITQSAYEFGVSAAALHKWIRQDRIDRGEVAGLTSRERVELVLEKKRIREFELEVEILRRASNTSRSSTTGKDDTPSLAYRTPIEFELTYESPSIPA